MIIQVDTSSLQASGQSLEASVSAPLIGLSGAAQNIGSALEGAVGAPVLTGAVDQFSRTLLQALQNGGLIAGLLGRGLTGGAGAYALTDQNAVPLNTGPAAPATPENPGTLRFH